MKTGTRAYAGSSTALVPGAMGAPTRELISNGAGFPSPDWPSIGAAACDSLRERRHFFTRARFCAARISLRSQPASKPAQDVTRAYPIVSFIFICGLRHPQRMEKRSGKSSVQEYA